VCSIDLVTVERIVHQMQWSPKPEIISLNPRCGCVTGHVLMWNEGGGKMTAPHGGSSFNQSAVEIDVSHAATGTLVDVSTERLAELMFDFRSVCIALYTR
jgi:hypothetical protein